MGTGEVEGTRSELNRLLHAAGQQIGLAHIAHPQRLTAHGPQRGTALLRLLQQRHGLGNTAGTGIRTAQGRGGLGEPEQHVINPAEIKAAFERRDGPGEAPLAQGEKTDTAIRIEKAEWGSIASAMRSASSAWAIPSGNAPSSARHRANQSRERTAGGAGNAKALTDQLTGKRLHIAPQQPHRPTMVAQSMVGHTQVMIRHHLQGEISERLSHGEGMLAGRDRAVMVPHCREMPAHIGGGPPQPRLVVEGLGEGCRLTEGVEHLPDVSEYQERRPQVESEVDGLLLRGTALREMREGCQGLLDARHNLSQGRTRERLGTGLPTVRHGLVPDLASEGMLRQPFCLLGQPVGIELFAGFDDAGVQGPAPPCRRPP